MSIQTVPPIQPQTPREREAYEAFYHEHKEAHVPQSPDQDRISDDVGDMLKARRLGLWVGRDLCCYWVPGNNRVYLAPDVLAGDPPEPDMRSRSYRQWDHGPIRLVLEITSRKRAARDREPKVALYAQALQPDEYFYFDPDRSDLRLWRWDGAAYQQIPGDALGRFWSRAVQLYFVAEDREIRLYDQTGFRLRNHLEETKHSERETARAEAERRQRETAERRAETAEQRAIAERLEREEAEQRAIQEAQQRQALEARLAALEAELEALRTREGDAGA